MVSVPGLHPVDQNIDTWWAERDPSAGVFNFNNGYNQVTTVAPGAGYWMKHSTADTLSTGDEWPAEGIQIVAHDPINGLAGWNLIGAFEQIVSVNSITTNPPGLQQGSVFGYSSGYSEATQLVPGYGYWIKLSAPGEIIIPNTALIGNRSKTKTNRDSWGKIILTDASGKSYTLYAVNENINLSEYDLPPLPPSEIFDVRYGSNRFAENLQGLTHSIIMQGLDYPVTAKAEAVTILLRDETGQKLNAVLNSGDQVVISDLSKIFISGNVLPVKFALEQNYPNPFNPITKIKYAIPQNSLVILTVYDILGSEVAKLVNEEKPSGSYEVEFDASIYSSGIYVYRLRAGNFAETKKMILLK
ncbi:MAG: T9SS type A sorting domain-containing protein [bacterium]|nr:T9SS type A sorting domain-containing protein [bacterium]